MKKLFSIIALVCATVFTANATDWTDTSWLADGAQEGALNETYKCICKEDLGVGFINNLQIKNDEVCIHICMPAADITSSLPETDYETEGAGFYPHISIFTAQETEFTVTCNGGNVYHFIVFFKNGVPTALDNLEQSSKARKVIENGQIVIIRNGIRYNALGAQIQ